MNRNIRRKPASVPLMCPGLEPGAPRWEAGEDPPEVRRCQLLGTSQVVLTGLKVSTTKLWPSSVRIVAKLDVTCGLLMVFALSARAPPVLISSAAWHEAQHRASGKQAGAGSSVQGRGVCPQMCTFIFTQYPFQ
jgi:hypothetical protein